MVCVPLSRLSKRTAFKIDLNMPFDLPTKRYWFERFPAIRALAWVWMLSGLHLTANAQTPPDAGSVRQQIEQQRAPALPAARPDRAKPPPEIRPTAGMTVRVRAFRFAGNSLLSTEQLAASLAEFTGRDLDFPGLQRAADSVAAAYREAGWIVRVYLPEQDVSEGIITLQVVEARFGGVSFEGDTPQRVKPDQLESIVIRQQASGQPLSATALDRALLLADDLPGVGVAGTLAPGAADSETALVLQATDEPFVYGDVGIDNTGARSTGSERFTANLSVNSPGGRGELLSVNGLHTQGSDYGRVALTVPDGYDGLRLGVSGSSMSYRVVDGPESIKTLNIQGRSSSLGLDWSYPIIRARLYNLYFAGGIENKHFHSDNRNSNPEDSKSYSDYDTNTLRVGLSGNRFDEWGGGGANSGSVQWVRGRLSDMIAHSQIDSIDRSYSKLVYSASRQQTIAGPHSVLFTLQGQHATQVLDSSEKLYIGGASTVRAYPVSELGGERGQFMSAEWRWRVGTAWVLSSFVDHGRVVSLPPTSSDAQTDLSLRGYGLSAGWQGPAGLVARLTWSRRIGAHPKPTQLGTDGDGTLKIDRIWLTTGLSF
jgi:hemolysin activation/secretion protein